MKRAKVDQPQLSPFDVPEILLCVASFLDFVSVARCCCVNRLFNTWFQQDSVWSALCFDRFGFFGTKLLFERAFLDSLSWRRAFNLGRVDVMRAPRVMVDRFTLVEHEAGQKTLLAQVFCLKKDGVSLADVRDCAMVQHLGVEGCEDEATRALCDMQWQLKWSARRRREIRTKKNGGSRNNAVVGMNEEVVVERGWQEGKPQQMLVKKMGHGGASNLEAAECVEDDGGVVLVGKGSVLEEMDVTRVMHSQWVTLREKKDQNVWEEKVEKREQKQEEDNDDDDDDVVLFNDEEEDDEEEDEDDDFRPNQERKVRHLNVVAGARYADQDEEEEEEEEDDDDDDDDDDYNMSSSSSSSSSSPSSHSSPSPDCPISHRVRCMDVARDILPMHTSHSVSYVICSNASVATWDRRCSSISPWKFQPSLHEAVCGSLRSDDLYLAMGLRSTVRLYDCRMPGHHLSCHGGARLTQFHHKEMLISLGDGLRGLPVDTRDDIVPWGDFRSDRRPSWKASGFPGPGNSLAVAGKKIFFNAFESPSIHTVCADDFTKFGIITQEQPKKKKNTY